MGRRVDIACGCYCCVREWKKYPVEFFPLYAQCIHWREGAFRPRRDKERARILVYSLHSSNFLPDFAKSLVVCTTFMHALQGLRTNTHTFGKRLGRRSRQTNTKVCCVCVAYLSMCPARNVPSLHARARHTVSTSAAKRRTRLSRPPRISHSFSFFACG